MKPFLIPIFTLFVIVSCKKEANTESKAFGNYMTYNIDSVYSEGDGSHHVECAVNDTTIDIICLENGISFLDLNLGINIGVGTHPFNSTYAPVLIYSDDPFNDECHSINGSVTISEHDTTNHYIKGTFYATVKQYGAEKLRNISNGQFQTHY